MSSIALYMLAVAVALSLCAIGYGLLLINEEVRRLNDFLREVYHE